MQHKIRRSAVLLMAALAPAPFVALASEPASEQVPLPEVAELVDGGTISTQEAVSEGMSCNFDGTDLACFDTQQQALAAVDEQASSEAVAAACTAAVTVYLSTGATGSSLNITQQGVWVNLGNFGATWNNSVSSWRGGCNGGRMADGTGGAGTRISIAANGVQTSLGSFNNLASSVRRCPC